MNKEFNKGLLLAGFGSFWWGFLGVLYFKYITFIGILSWWFIDVCGQHLH